MHMHLYDETRRQHFERDRARDEKHVEWRVDGWVATRHYTP